MGFVMAPQWVGLVRGKGSPQEKRKSPNRRANGGAVLAEMMQERRCHSVNFDPSRSRLNEYESDRETGQASWDEMVRRANDYRISTVGKGGAAVERALRKDAVIGWALIFNPPMEVSEGWDDETAARFFRDCREVTAEFLPVTADRNVRCVATHRDEGGLHVHVAGEMLDEDGRYCAKEQWNITRFARLNREFGARMRDRGWDMDDLDTFDVSRKDDESYREERRRKRRTQGLDQNDYARRKAEERARQARAEAREAERAKGEAVADQAEAEIRARLAKAEMVEVVAAKDKAMHDRDVIAGSGKYRDREGNLHEGIEALKGRRDSLEGQIQGLEDGVAAAKRREAAAAERAARAERRADDADGRAEEAMARATDAETRAEAASGEAARAEERAAEAMAQRAAAEEGAQRAQEARERAEEALEAVKAEEAAESERLERLRCKEVELAAEVGELEEGLAAIDAGGGERRRYLDAHQGDGGREESLARELAELKELDREARERAVQLGQAREQAAERVGRLEQALRVARTYVEGLAAKVATLMSRLGRAWPRPSTGWRRHERYIEFEKLNQRVDVVRERRDGNVHGILR